MRAATLILGALSVLVGPLAASVSAFTADEHRMIAEEAVELVAPDCNGIIPAVGAVIYDNKTLPQLCENWARDDRSFARYHRKGESIVRQLSQVTDDELQRKFDIALSHGDEIADLEDRTGGVIVNFFIYHHVAMRLAVWASESPVRDRVMIDRFLAYEAQAQGYLVDAFSSAHMLMPSSGILNAVLDCNLANVHDHFRDEGLYVINSQGECWRTFGDGLLYYYPATHGPILEASVTSLHEVCLVYAVSRDAVPSALADWAESVMGEDYQTQVEAWIRSGDGHYYYHEARLPSLMELPMPVSATWSVRRAAVDSLGIADRIHYPQLNDSTMHDPSLEKQLTNYLYSPQDVGSWMHFDRLYQKSPLEIVKSDVDVASVRFVQKRDLSPAYEGLLTTYSLTGVVNDRGNGWGATLGLGYGVADDLLLVQNLSIEARIAPGFDESERFLLLFDVGATADLDLLTTTCLNVSLPRWVRRARFDLAFVTGLRDRYQTSGVRLFAGWELPTIKMPFVYMGFTPRVGYQVTMLERNLHGPVFEIILH